MDNFSPSAKNPRTIVRGYSSNQLVVDFSLVYGFLTLYLVVVPGIDLEKISGFVTGAGFAALVALWFMFRHDSKLDRLIDAVHELTNVVSALLRRDGFAVRVGTGGKGDNRDS